MEHQKNGGNKFQFLFHRKTWFRILGFLGCTPGIEIRGIVLKTLLEPEQLELFVVLGERLEKTTATLIVGIFLLESTGLKHTSIL